MHSSVDIMLSIIIIISLFSAALKCPLNWKYHYKDFVLCSLFHLCVHHALLMAIRVKPQTLIKRFWLLAGKVWCYKYFCLYTGRLCIVRAILAHINYAIYFQLTYAQISAFSALIK